ncbi:MAG: hypothetical protein L3K10_01325 [Thermoplasmata archaeon]|nr:hypothetical protein [Thermoplasmata archaeon]
MVHIKDEGSLFEAPIDVVWKYHEDAATHARAHTSTRNPSFKPVSPTVFVYTVERESRGQWTGESIQITVLQPLGFAFEWVSGPLTGSTMVYLYTPRGEKTQIDVVGEFVSSTIPSGQLEQHVRDWLQREFNEDAPAVRALARKT